ncbi:MAG TPA: class I SAM-dependent methyltransferase [Gemmatimonadaceae bacterium]|jgi:SAM-dependent methyltransferase
MQPADDLRREFGDIDVYLFDQLLRGRITEGMRILDAGCGRGRNLVYLLRRGFAVSATDASADAVALTRALAASLAPALGGDRFRVEPVEQTSFDAQSFDVVISSAVLHFARDEAHFAAMVREMWRVLAPGGLLFARLATTIGHETRVQPLGGRRYIMPDGSERLLVDEDFVMTATRELGGTLADPLKTSVVQDRRSMMTWVVRKSAG